MKNVYFAFLFFAGLLFSSCDNKLKSTQDFWIDNPLAHEIVVVVDETEYKIPPLAGVSVTLESGVHNLKYDGLSVDFLSKRCNQAVVLNPTLSNYFLGYNAFFDEKDLEKGDEQLEKITEAYLFDYEFEPGAVVKAPFKLTNDLFIERYDYYWNFDIMTPFPSVVSVREDAASALSVLVQSKLFREKDYLEFANGILPEGYVFPKNTTKLSDLQPFVLVPEAMYPECQDARYIGDEINAKFDSLKIVAGDEFNAVLFRLERMSYDDRIINRDMESECEEDFGKKLLEIDRRIRSVGSKSAFVIN